MGAQGTTTLDFGAFPGASDASVTVTGQAGILAGSLVEAWIRPVDTADHLADEHMVETLKVFAHTIVPGTGFTISGFNTSQVNEGLNVGYGPARGGAGAVPNTAATSGAANRINNQLPGQGGIGTRIYGQWTVAWVWN